MTACVVSDDWPPGPDTVSVTGYVPAAEYAWATTEPCAVVPSPNDHKEAVIDPLEADPLRVTGVPTTPVYGPPARATGAGVVAVTRMLCVLFDSLDSATCERSSMRTVKVSELTVRGKTRDRVRVAPAASWELVAVVEREAPSSLTRNAPAVAVP
jgi:hypothetical protein